MKPVNPDFLTPSQRKRHLLPRTWKTDTEFLGPRIHTGGGWTITENDGLASLRLRDYPHLAVCAATSPRAARRLTRTLGAFLLDAGPAHWALRAEPLEGWHIGGDSDDCCFWPQADGSVVVAAPPTCPAELDSLLRWTLPLAIDEQHLERYPTASDFLHDTLGPSYHQAVTADTALLEIVATLGPEWEGTFPALISTALELYHAV